MRMQHGMTGLAIILQQLCRFFDLLDEGDRGEEAGEEVDPGHHLHGRHGVLLQQTIVCWQRMLLK